MGSGKCGCASLSAVQAYGGELVYAIDVLNVCVCLWNVCTYTLMCADECVCVCGRCAPKHCCVLMNVLKGKLFVAA
jgi:hypothetical protein